MGPFLDSRSLEPTLGGHEGGFVHVHELISRCTAPKMINLLEVTEAVDQLCDSYTQY